MRSLLRLGPIDRRSSSTFATWQSGWSVSASRTSAGTFNATNTGVSWRELLETCRDVAGSEAEIVWVPDEFLVEQGVGEWMELPLWIVDPAMSAADEAVVDRALAAGLHVSASGDTVRGTLDDAKPTETAGLTPEREAALLAAWHAR